MTGDVTQLILKDIVQQLRAFCSFAASSGLCSQYFQSKILILGAVCCWSMWHVGFLLNETLHVPLEFDKDCSTCRLNPIILHNALGVALMCKRVISLWDSSPIYLLLTFTTLVLSPATVPAVRVLVFLGAATLSRWEGQMQYSWLQYGFRYRDEEF